MLKKAITYKDIDGITVTEEYHFQIDRSEASKILMIEGDDYGEQLKKLVAQREGKKIMEAFDNLLSAAVGKREGKLFLKSDDIYKQFRFSGAYDQFFMELINSEDSGGSQLAAMFPAEAQEQILKNMKQEGIAVELPTAPPVLDGQVADQQVQVEKPQPDTIPQPSQFPQGLEKAIENNRPAIPEPIQQSENDDPLWLQEGRSPTRQEMMRMSKDELQFAFKMKEAGLLK